MKKSMREMIEDIVNETPKIDEESNETRREQVIDQMSVFELTTPQILKVFEKLQKKQIESTEKINKIHEDLKNAVSPETIDEFFKVVEIRSKYLEKPTSDTKRSFKNAVYKILANMTDKEIDAATKAQREIVEILR